jgi:arylformamidase
MTANGLALAQPAPAARAKGPLVWLDMDQKELDNAYDQRVYAPNMDQVIARCARNSELARERVGAPKRLAYGVTPIKALDLYSAKAANAPINIYVHCGAWRTGLAKNNAFHAEMLLNAGAHLAVLDFNNVIETDGSLMIMAEQIRRVVAWVYKNARSFSGDPERLYVSGHSSGGHWVGVLLTTDWQKDFGMPPTRGQQMKKPQNTSRATLRHAPATTGRDGAIDFAAKVEASSTERVMLEMPPGELKSGRSNHPGNSLGTLCLTAA